jgi:3-keto-disaccharide hydrolase
MATRAWMGLALVLGSIAGPAAADESQAEPIAPAKNIQLFNGRDLSGLTTWLKDTQRDDPRKVFQVTDGMIHLSGEGNGYVATEREYRDYHLIVEYKWGRRTDGGKYVRNSGVLLHAVGPDGNAGEAWPSCIECQLAQGCVGDLILIRGKDAKGEEIPVQITAETELAPDGRRHRWKQGGEVKTFPPTRGQFWWNKHDWDFQELLDTRGRDDVESQVGEWTRVECLCGGKRITIKVNGQTVNECYDVYPAAGRILLQTEGFEIYFRKFEIQPLNGEPR